jgi:hypothetical protein
MASGKLQKALKICTAALISGVQVLLPGESATVGNNYNLFGVKTQLIKLHRFKVNVKCEAKAEPFGTN